MAYCNKADLIARGWETELISLSDKEGLLNGVMNDAALEQAISDVSAEIDSHLVGHIPLPLVAPSEFLIRKACDMVRFYLYDIGVIEPVSKRYEAAIEFLAGVSTGATMLSSLMAAPVDPTAAESLIQVPLVTAPVTVFSDSLMAKM
jgi:phage gp36-like protein